VAEIAERAGMSVEEVAETLDAGRAYSAAELDAPTGDTDEPGTQTLLDTVGSEDPHFDYVELGESMGPAFHALPEREQRIVKLRLIDDLDQRQIAEIVGISQMHVSRLLRRAFAQLAESAGVSDAA
jgi:RNA polymerase sigma-B factor